MFTTVWLNMVRAGFLCNWNVWVTKLPLENGKEDGALLVHNYCAQQSTHQSK